MQATQKVESTELIKFDAPELASIEPSKADKIEALEAENARLELKLAYHEKVRTKLLNEKDAEIRRLRQEKSELVEILRKLREASHHSPEVDWLGDDDPWEEADAALAKGGELIL
jgi:hypothetical protein